MKRLIYALIIAFVMPVAAFAYKLSVDSIPLELRENAAAVVRTHQMVYTVLSPGKAKASYRMVLTLMNESVDYLRLFEINYDNFMSVTRVNAAVYDANGKFIETIPSSRIMDVSEGGGFISDARMKRIIFPVNRYPFTIEVEYDVTINGSLNLDQWAFHSDPYLSVEESAVQYIIPNLVPFRYSEHYMNASFDSIRTADNTIYTWVQRQIPAIRKWYFSPLAVSRPPFLLASIEDFEFGGIKGSMRTWKSLGQWAWELNRGLDQLGDAEKKRVADLTSGLKNDWEKAEALYHYMQSRTRYASIQLGIGGYKPAPAMEVSEKGYGDCKGLTNYMYALLREAGITSYYTWVRSGTNKFIIPDFVSDQFDHIILCVPLQGDTVWLECTSQTIPFNYLGSFTSDRDVLLITPEGGKMVRTPQFSHSYRKSTGVITLGRREAARGSFTMTSGGLGFDKNRIFSGKTVTEMKRMINEGMAPGTFSTDTAAYREITQGEPVSELEFDLTFNDFAIVAGTRMHFNPCLNGFRHQPFDTISVRIYEVEDIIDSIVYRFPAGYRAEYIPPPVSEEGPYGSYRYNIETLNDGSLLFRRSLSLNKGIYTGDRARDLFAFLNTAARSDQRRIYLNRAQSY
jgi:transglutaminase-like putative cysteine protease